MYADMQTARSNTVVLCMDEKMMREKLVQVLERGKESATQIRRLIDHQDDHDHLDSRQLDAHSLDVLTAFATALSMIHYNFPSFNDDHDHQGLKRPNPTLKSQVFEDYWEAPNTPRNARGSYKRRKPEEAVEIETQNTDDGYAWRKYGQKFIQHTKHPRSYYRCTHKIEQGCRATKQVQQISDNPPKYKIVYHGHHTCKNPLKTSPMCLDLIDQDNSSIFLSFGKPSNPNHGPNPFMLPSSSSSLSSTTSAAPIGNAMVEQVSTLVKDEIPLKPVDQHHGVHIQCPSSSDCLSTSYDLRNTSFLSDDFTSLAEIYSAAVSPHGVEEDYSYMMAESCDFSEVLQDTHLVSGRCRSLS